MTYYERKLPHWHPERKALFVTWRLHSSIPAAVRQQQLSAGKRFVVNDRALDRAEGGPLWLKDPRLAKLVADALVYGDKHLKLYELVAYTVMANHVHVLLWPLVPLPKITRALKGYTAREANRMLDRTGEAFWCEESYDHWIRNNDEFQRVIAYIEHNPVAAGIVARPEDWPWSSAAGPRMERADEVCSQAETGRNACRY